MYPPHRVRDPWMNRHVFRHDGECGLTQEVVDVLPLGGWLCCKTSRRILGMPGQPFRIDSAHSRAHWPHPSCAVSILLPTSRLSSRSRARSTRRVVVRVRAGTRQAAAFVKLMGAMSQDTNRRGPDRGPSGTQWPRAVSVTRAAAGILSRPLRSSLCRDYRDGEPRHHVERRDQQNDGQFAASADERLGASPVGALMWLPEKTTLPDTRPS
jgi:hypothetical protein